MLDSYYANANQWINYSHTRSMPLKNAEFHLHNRFEIYFFVAGAVNYFIENQVYHLNFGDLLLINNHEIHKPTFLSGQLYDRIVIHFEPELGNLLSAPQFDLLHCFLHRPQGVQNKVNLNPSELDKLLKLFTKLEDLVANPAADMLKLLCFIEILVLINQAFVNIKPAVEDSNVPEALVPILAYIETHLDADLTLKNLGKQFFMDQFYLSRLFKKSIGSNLHEFIIYKRIAQAKKLLREGNNVTATCALCGFNDYANFLRIFKRKVGVSPGKYKSEKYITL